MDWIVLEGVKPYDGRYPLDAEQEFSTREWGWLKRLAGYMPLTIEDGFNGGDPELFAALALIALHRAGKVQAPDVSALYQRMVDLPFMTTIRVETDDDAGGEREGDAGPPARSSTGKPASSGAASTTSSETSPGGQNGSGTPASDSSASPPVTWPT